MSSLCPISKQSFLPVASVSSEGEPTREPQVERGETIADGKD